MEIQLYKNNSSNNTMTKSLTPVTTISGTLKDECSIIDPEILVAGTSQFINANYAYIPEFHRYYYINNITIVKNGLYRLSLHSDVLMSFKDSIKGMNAIVARSSDNSNMYIIDTKMKTLQYNNYNVYASNKSFDSSLTPYIVVAG